MLGAREHLTPARIALLVSALAAATVAGAWAFQAFGYAPCDLCLQQRWAYYAGAPLALLVGGAATTGRRTLALTGFALVAGIFVANGVFGAWHAGVEWRFWPGPSGCTGAFAPAGDMGDFLRQMEAARLVRCDEVALRILGLSLAGWNALISTGLAALAVVAALGLRRARA